MIRFFNHERISKPVTNFNDTIKYVLLSQTTGFTCDTQFEADMLNYIIKNESYGEVDRPGTYLWVNDEESYILEDDIDS